MLLIQFNVGFTYKIISGTDSRRGDRGERELITSNQLHCHHQNDFRIKMGSDVRHFNVSLILVLCKGKVTRQCVSINHNF